MQAQVWTVGEQTATSVELHVDLVDGLGGFPGNRRVTVTYALDGAALRMDVTAETDAPTVMNPANHSYWVLDPGLGFAGHRLRVDTARYTEPNDALMPTGRVLDVDGSPYDFRNGLQLTGNADQFFDLNLCLSDTRQDLRPVAWLTGTAGVSMEMSTTECGLQVYDCGTIDAPNFATHHGAPIRPYSGLALEAQSWPGALAHDHFPSILLHPGETYRQSTGWRFMRTEP